MDGCKYLPFEGVLTAAKLKLIAERKQKYKQTQSQTERETNRQRYKSTKRRTDRETNRQKERKEK